MVFQLPLRFLQQEYNNFRYAVMRDIRGFPLRVIDAGSYYRMHYLVRMVLAGPPEDNTYMIQ